MLTASQRPPHATQTFGVDAYVYLAFRDDRINATAGFVDGDPVLFDNAWEPLLEIINVAEGETSALQYTASFAMPKWIDDDALIAGGYSDVADAKSGSWVLGQSRQKAILTAKLNLAAFPYDKQETGIIMESTTWESRDLKWVPVAAAKAGIVPQGDKYEAIGGWILTGSDSVVTDKAYTAFNQVYSRLELTVKIDRQSYYYTSRFVFGVGILVVMAILVLFMVGEEPDRLGFVQSSFLGVISFEFILVLILPPLGYNTRIDDFLMLSFGVIFVIYIYNCVRVGYFKTLENLSGRSEDEGKPGDAPEKGAGGGAAATTENPMHGQQSGAGGAGSAGSAGNAAAPAAPAKHDDAEGATREKTNDLRKIFTVKRVSCCWAGSWAELNPHRKLDVIFGVGVSVIYVIATIAILFRAGVVKEVS